MSNEKVILQFLNKEKGRTNLRTITNGIYQYKGRTLETTGKRLVNYNTIIAYWDDEKNIIHLNTKKYSSTTSKIQSLIKRLATSKGVDIIEYN